MITHTILKYDCNYNSVTSCPHELYLHTIFINMVESRSLVSLFYYRWRSFNLLLYIATNRPIIKNVCKQYAFCFIGTVHKTATNYTKSNRFIPRQNLSEQATVLTRRNKKEETKLNRYYTDPSGSCRTCGRSTYSRFPASRLISLCSMLSASLLYGERTTCCMLLVLGGNSQLTSDATPPNQLFDNNANSSENIPPELSDMIAKRLR